MASAPEKSLEVVSLHVRPNYVVASLQRIAVLLGILGTVALIVSVTPMPEEYFLSCDRPCHELDWPMICRVKLTMEVYKTMSRACGDCPSNESECSHPHCAAADGYQRGILAVDRRLPGPTVQVCVNDILVVDVVNRVPGQGLSIHWRGQPQKETPFMDGVPMITQCPIPSYTTFQYKFRASAPGTHMYHAHSGAETADGILGAFIVRQPDKIEPSRRYYDEDRTDHVIVVSEWSHGFAIQNLLDIHSARVESLLINGRGSLLVPDKDISVPPSTFTVKKGRKYRFRLAYGGGVRSCPIVVSIDNHTLKMIALDGHPIDPENVNSITLGRGERVDFVVHADREIGSYLLQVSSAESCLEKVRSVANLQYEGSDVNTNTEISPTQADSDLESVIFKEFSSVDNDNKCDSDETFCVSELRALHTMPEQLRRAKLDQTLFIPFHYEKLRSRKRIETIGSVDGFRFTFPGSPLLTQGSDVPSDVLCGAPNEHAHAHAECVHIKEVPLGAPVEIIMFDQGGYTDHIYHLHGYSFYLVASRQFNRSMSMERVRSMHDDGTLFHEQNLYDPLQKDTITIPKFGVVALRFVANNPGYWMMRDEKANHWTRGLDFLLKVGHDVNFVKAPADFPKCGSYIGPEYFLI